MIVSDIVIDFKRNYDVCVEQANNYDLVLDNGQRSLDITVSGLITQSEIYGDELEPLIMYLKTNSELTPYLILINDSLEEQSKSIHIALKTALGDISNAMWFYVDKQDLSLISSLDDISTSVLLQTISSDMGLSIDMEIVAISYLTSEEKNTFRLNSYIDEDLLVTIYFDEISHNIKVEETPLDMQIDTTFAGTTFDIPLYHYLSKVVLSTYINIISDTNISHLESSANVDRATILGGINEAMRLTFYEYADSYVSFNLTLQQSISSLKTGMDFEYWLMDYDPYFLNEDMDEISLKTLDSADAIIQLEVFVNCTANTKMNMYTNDEMKIEPAPDFYYDYLLMSMDDHTITKLEAELEFEQGGIVVDDNNENEDDETEDYYE